MFDPDGRVSRAGALAVNPIEIGEKVADIRLPLVNGEGDTGFSDYAGKRLIVFAWASW
jgi:hypothetical protein